LAAVDRAEFFSPFLPPEFLKALLRPGPGRILLVFQPRFLRKIAKRTFSQLDHLGIFSPMAMRFSPHQLFSGIF